MTKCRQILNHPIQLQLSDAAGYPVPNTEFWVKLTIVYDKPEVKIQLHFITFTGPVAPDDPFGPVLLQSSGVSNDGIWFPAHSSATELNRLSIRFGCFQQRRHRTFLSYDSSAISSSISWLVLSRFSSWRLIIQAAGAFGNVIPPGGQVLSVVPTNISYLASPREKLGYNLALSTGATNVTQFTNPLPKMMVFETLMLTMPLIMFWLGPGLITLW